MLHLLCCGLRVQTRTLLAPIIAAARTATVAKQIALVSAGIDTALFVDPSAKLGKRLVAVVTCVARQLPVFGGIARVIVGAVAVTTTVPPPALSPPPPPPPPLPLFPESPPEPPEAAVATGPT